jgi:hypothetical protein
MELQTLLLWTARLACPIAMGLMVWWFLRQSGEAQEPSPTPTQDLVTLQKRRAALDAEIRALESETDQPVSVEATQRIEMGTPTA